MRPAWLVFEEDESAWADDVVLVLVEVIGVGVAVSEAATVLVVDDESGWAVDSDIAELRTEVVDSGDMEKAGWYSSGHALDCLQGSMEQQPSKLLIAQV